MCRRVSCSKCNKPTFAGCGQHVEQVLGDVPKADRCRCHEKASAGAPAGPVSAPAEKPWWKPF
jgi:hypothetical protein